MAEWGIVAHGRRGMQESWTAPAVCFVFTRNSTVKQLKCSHKQNTIWYRFLNNSSLNGRMLRFPGFIQNFK